MCLGGAAEQIWGRGGEAWAEGALAGGGEGKGGSPSAAEGLVEGGGAGAKPGAGPAGLNLGELKRL